MGTTIKINTEDLAISSQTIEDYGFEFDKKDLKKRLKYLIRANQKCYEKLENTNSIYQYALGDTINILQLIKNSL